MAIDDPLEKIREFAKQSGFDAVGTSLQVGGILSPVFKVFSIANSIAASRQSGERIFTAILALCDELQRMQDALPKDMEKAFETVWFKKALNTLMEQSARAVDDDWARLLARAAAHGCFPTGQNAHRQEDLASYIEDLARLGTDDLQFLRLLSDVNSDAIRRAPNLNLPDVFTQNFQMFKKRASELKIDEDDCVSLGARLGGFGLAYENPRVSTSQSPREHCFRPTKRGLYLLSLLDAAETPIAKQN